MNKVIVVAGIILALLWLSVAWVTFGIPLPACNALKAATFGLFDKAIGNMHNGFYYDVPNKNMPTTAFLFLFSIAFIIYFVVSIYTSKKPFYKETLPLIILFSILFRLILLASVSVHECDFYRYLWDGKTSMNGINPFKYAPKEIMLKDDVNNNEIVRLDALRKENPVYFERINHSGVPTIYPPFAQLIFALSNIIRQDSILVLKSLLILFDVLAFFVIIGLLSHLKMNPSLCIIYGWSPLVLKEIANSAHYDSIAIFLLLLSIYFLFKNKTAIASITTALAIATKFFPIFLVPLSRKQTKNNGLIVMISMLTLLYVPFFFWSGSGIQKVFSGLSIYSEKWAYNGSAFVIVQAILNKFHFQAVNELFLAKVVTGLIFLSIVIYLSQKKLKGEISLMHGSLCVLVTLFLLSPVGEPWYFCWVIPFLCFFPYRSLLLLSWLLIFSYLSFNHDFGTMKVGGIELPILNAIQYVPFFLFFIWEFVIRKGNTLDYVK